MIRALLFGIGIAFAPVGLASAQQTTEPKFEVVSIKPNADVGAQLGVRPVGNGRFSAAITPKMLIQVAYGFPAALLENQIVGLPDWRTRDSFEISATFGGDIAEQPGGPPVRLFAMMKALLADRFGLRLRLETRQLSTYDLVVDRPDRRLGPMLRIPDGQCIVLTTPPFDFSRACGFRQSTSTALTARGVTISDLAARLAHNADVQRIVRDRTGLTGGYDFDLAFVQVSGSAEPPAGASIFTALREQLGLALRPSTGPVDVLVVDRIERPTPD